MSGGLTILTPGALAMASEDVFALMDQCRLMASACASSARRLGMTDSWGGELGLAMAALREAEQEFDSLAFSLQALASEAAAQERWRQGTLWSLRDRFLYAAVAGAAWSGSGKGEAWVTSMTGKSDTVTTPRSQLQGAEDGSVMDDVAAILAGHPHPLPVVSVQVTSAIAAVGPAQSMAERISRIPDTKQPIRIETYRLLNGDTHAEVYIAGTHEWGVGFGSTPFDLESNLKLVAGQTALSVVATTQALRLAGVTPGDSVTFIGHSQGGAVATTLAESGIYNTRGLVTAGSPTGTLPVRGHYPAVVIEHTNDVVPGLGGERLTTQATVVTRHSGHRLMDLYGAHSAEGYRQTAAMIDRSTAPELSTLSSPVPVGARGRATLFSATRQPDPQPLG